MNVSTSPERPIENSSEDKLERSRFVERLTNALVNPSNKRSTGVVVGITGPWGSGKSSILNLLSDHVQGQYPNALIVRFDPWLVSGSVDLISEFFGELIGTIRSDEHKYKKFKKLGSTLVEYGQQLAPIANYFLPGAGSAASGALGAAKKVLDEKESLAALRSRIRKELADLSEPIVVLIDELDRIEDGEIRTVAQLVRSVLDFPNVSYVLAFDADRVMQALGTGGSTARERRERGRSYLEKIVQLQIPIPITLGEEIERLLLTELTAIKVDLQLPDKFEGINRFKNLVEILVAEVTQTPRDIRRLIGTFHVLAGMLLGEVDWIDLLAYSALLVKAPATVAKMRNAPDDFLNEPRSQSAIERMISDRDLSSDERFKKLIPPSELNNCTVALLEFLLPGFSELHEASADYEDAFRERRAFLSTLRLGLLPGSYSRDSIRKLFASSSNEIASALKTAYEKESIDAIIDRIDDLYLELPIERTVKFWRGIAKFAKKPTCEWMTSYSPMHEKIRNLVGILEKTVRRDEKYREVARRILLDLQAMGENELLAYWLRSHIFTYGLFGNKVTERKSWVLSHEQTETMSRELAMLWLAEHLSDKLIPCRWDLQCIYTMVDMGVWDERCKEKLDHTLESDEALDGFTLLLFGGHYSNGRDTIAKICSLENYLDRVRSRISSDVIVHESVRVALGKATGRDFD